MSAAEVLGRYRLRQSENCFRLGRESLLLSRFATLRPGFAVCDLGCGIGTLLLLLSEREADIGRWGIELDPEAAALARENLAENGLEGRIVQADLRRPGLLPASHFQLVISNPPYFAKGSGKSGGGARMEENLSLPELCRTAMRLLRARGRFALSYRPERLPALFSALESAHLAPKRMQLLCHRRGKEPFAVLVEAVKDGAAGLSVLPNHYEEEAAP